MKKEFIIKTLSGRWAVGMGIALFAATALSLIFAIAVGGDSALVESRPLFSILAALLSVVFTFSAPLSLIIGLYTAFRHKEWLVIKLLALFYLVSFFLFMIGELLFPH